MEYQSLWEASYHPFEHARDFLSSCLSLAIRLTEAVEALVVVSEEAGGGAEIALRATRERCDHTARPDDGSPETPFLSAIFDRLRDRPREPFWWDRRQGRPETAGWTDFGLALPIHYQDRLVGVLVALWQNRRPDRRPACEALAKLARDIAFHCQRFRVRRLAAGKLGKEVMIVGAGKAMRRIDAFVEKASRTELTVLITGEVGCGKELAAYSIHFGSPRRGGPFVAVNCAALPRDLAESMLFGHVKGSFTGAGSNQPGYFEQAEGGTIFLDEIGELDLVLQAKLLRTIQFGELQKLGGRVSQCKADIRVIAATSRNLEQWVSEGKFSEALYSRLNFLRLELPPLRERIEDLEALAEHFVRRYCPDRERALSKEALAMLQRHCWPTNVRELESVIARLVTFSDGPEVSPEDVRELAPCVSDSRLERDCTEQSAEESLPLQQRIRKMVEDFEKCRIEEALCRNVWNVSRAARELGTSHQNLFKKIKKYGIERPVAVV